MAHFEEYKNSIGEIEKDNIMKIIPYNEHFLFVDKILNLSPSRIIAVKDITGKEDFLKGHFVGFPIMPGALTVEGMGQTATILARSNAKDHQTKEVLAYKLKEVKFSAPVFVGSQLRYEIDLIAQDERGAIFQGKSFVKDNLVAEALFVVAIVDRSDFRSKFK